MGESKGFAVGEMYKAISEGEEVGKVLYLGSSYKNYIRFFQSHNGRVHLIAFKNKVGGIKCLRFHDHEYEFIDGKLKIRVSFKQKISPLERKFIDDLLRRWGL
ncbi:MAG: hypothetical protein AABX79_01665 [Nanoarchaeota archaeon]